MSNPRSLTRVASHILNCPLMVTPRHASVILSAMRSHLNVDLLVQSEGPGLDRLAMSQLAAQGLAYADDRDERRAEQSYKVFAEQNGIAIVPITGTLTKTWGLDPESGFTGYDGIKTKIAAAMDDEAISAIYLDIDSPGGAVSGNFDLCDFIFACRQGSGGKPIIAIANEMACSAAFSIGASADELYVTRTGYVGSVGVVLLYTNIEEALAEAGIKVRIFRAGEHKYKGNAYEAMDEDTAARIQADLDACREIFIETVARGRGISKKQVRDTEALAYMGANATGIKFATDVLSDDQVWAKTLRRFGR